MHSFNASFHFTHSPTGKILSTTTKITSLWGKATTISKSYLVILQSIPFINYGFILWKSMHYRTWSAKRWIWILNKWWMEGKFYGTMDILSKALLPEKETFVSMFSFFSPECNKNCLQKRKHLHNLSLELTLYFLQFVCNKGKFTSPIPTHTCNIV